MKLLTMKRFKLWLAPMVIFAGLAWWFDPSMLPDMGLGKHDVDRIMDAWGKRTSNILVEVEGRVALLMPVLEVKGRQQQFMVVLENGHRLVISHDLELSRSVPVEVNNKIRVKGEYDWTYGGGHIHWTHSDPTGDREGGWIEHLGIRYD